MNDGTADWELVQEWRELHKRHGLIQAALDRALNDQHGLGLSEFEVLDHLVDQDDCHQWRVQEVAQSVHLSQSALSRVIARLEKDGLVCRTICETDRRGIFVALTPQGVLRHKQACPTHRKVLAETFTATAPAAAR